MSDIEQEHQSEQLDKPVVIDIKNLHKCFGPVKALEDVNLTLRQGEVIVVIGPSGCGKTTLLRCINRLEEPSSGRVWLEDKEITALPENGKELDQIRSRIGMVFQQFNLFPHLTAIRNVSLAPYEVLGLSKKEAESKAMELLELLDVSDKRDSYPNQLSGGEQQRVGIARTLAMEPDVIMFDEPTSALDPEMIKEVLEAMRYLANKGMSMLVVSHEMNFAREVGDWTVFMDGGKIIEIYRSNEKPENPRTKEFLKAIINT